MAKKEKDKKMVVFGKFFKTKMGAFKDILVILGKSEEVRKIDKEYQKRKLLGPWGLEEVARLYKGFPNDELKKIAWEYCQEKLMPGIREIVAELKRKGFLVGGLSSNPQFIMDTLKEILLLDFSRGTQLEFKDGIATGRIQEKVDRYTKAKILRDLKKEYKLRSENIIVFYGSITDLPMAKEAGIFIGFNPEEENIGDIARIISTNANLRKIFFGKSKTKT